MLVGVPVFRVPELVTECLKSLQGTPADVLVIDNASDLDVKTAVQKFNVKIVENHTNTFCNGAWNQIMEYGIDHEYDLVGLGSSDALLHPGWYTALLKRVGTYPKEVLIPAIGEPVDRPDFTKAEVVTGGVPGYFSFLPIEAVKLVYPIPRNLKHWFGDQYMFEKLRSLGWRTVVLSDVRAYHQQSAITARTPEAYVAIKEDIREWNNASSSSDK